MAGKDALGFGFEAGVGLPNPIEANRSSSEAPRSFFFLGFAAIVGFFFGPRLVMFMAIPPICDGFDEVRDDAAVVAIDVFLIAGGAEEDGIVSDMAVATEPVDLGAAGMLL